MLYESVVFFCCSTGHWLKPMCVVTGALLHSPTLHALGNAVGHFAAQMLLIVDGFLQEPHKWRVEDIQTFSDD